MTNKIKKIGSVQNLDSDGFIINSLSLDDIQEEYRAIIDDVKQYYTSTFQENLHSIYIRGSVAKGKAVPLISDLDSVALTHNKIEDVSKQRNKFRDEVSTKYPTVNGVELLCLTLDEVNKSERLQFLLKTQCICIFGEDFKNEIPKYGIGEPAYAHSNAIESGIDSMEKWLKEETAEADLKQTCSWIMKRTVRVGFELIMKKEKCFTRDLYPCYEMFAKHYPNKEKEMFEALKLAVFPTADKAEIREVTYSLNDFLISEAKKRK